MSWLVSNNELERERTVNALLCLLNNYQENLNSGNKVLLLILLFMLEIIYTCENKPVYHFVS